MENGVTNATKTYSREIVFTRDGSNNELYSMKDTSRKGLDGESSRFAELNFKELKKCIKKDNNETPGTSGGGGKGTGDGTNAGEEPGKGKDGSSTPSPSPSSTPSGSPTPTPSPTPTSTPPSKGGDGTSTPPSKGGKDPSQNLPGQN